MSTLSSKKENLRSVIKCPWAHLNLFLTCPMSQDRVEPQAPGVPQPLSVKPCFVYMDTNSASWVVNNELVNC